MVRKNRNDDPNWGNNSTRNYVLLKQNASLASLEPKLKFIKRRHTMMRKQMKCSFILSAGGDCIPISPMALKMAA
jgi:hypothetical protein